ncbi:MAG: tail fiber domain-containing protein, partial [Bacteroidetes bacterium]|nr:tail fiber domain-containing protein [Bacteroidota bacterium]
SNTSGLANAANGWQALYNNTSGNNNTANGWQALYNNTTGNSNTAYGYQALVSNSTGFNNTAIGFGADVGVGSYSNSSAFGSNLTITASNQVRIGNPFVTSIGGQVGWTSLSDGRMKENVKEEVPGLSFINSLRPVTYTLNTKKFDNFIMQQMPDSVKAKRMQTEEAYSTSSSILHTGFIAQEVEAAAKKVGFNFDGVDAPKNEHDLYGLRYAEFVVPLVKSVQELSVENIQLKSDIATLKKQMEELTTLIKTNK